MKIELSEDLNLTVSNFSEVRMIEENFLGSALMLVNYFIMEVFGNGMLLVIILYERFAMDPQKRFVNNMLLSCLCLTAILANVIPISQWRHPEFCFRGAKHTFPNIGGANYGFTVIKSQILQVLKHPSPPCCDATGCCT